MGTLRDYLVHKRHSWLARQAALDAGTLGPTTPSAHVIAEGGSGIRRIRIRDHQILSDSDFSFAGYDLGPTSPELQLGVLGSCLTHIFLIQAAAREVPLDSIEVEVTGRMDPRAGRTGYEDVPVYPHDISYTVEVATPVDEQTLAALFAAVERACPVLNLIRHPQQITGSLRRVSPAPS